MAYILFSITHSLDVNTIFRSLFWFAAQVLWLDSVKDGEPYVGACCGTVQTILELAGAVNVMQDVGVDERSTWATVSWEEIAASDPNLIVVVEASWDSVGAL
jgi:iron complex transport system substrate-binding protein